MGTLFQASSLVRYIQPLDTNSTRNNPSPNPSIIPSTPISNNIIYPPTFLPSPHFPSPSTTIPTNSLFNAHSAKLTLSVLHSNHPSALTPPPSSSNNPTLTSITSPLLSSCDQNTVAPHRLQNPRFAPGVCEYVFNVVVVLPFPSGPSGWRSKTVPSGWWMWEWGMKAQAWRSWPVAKRQELQAQRPARYLVPEARRYHF